MTQTMRRTIIYFSIHHLIKLRLNSLASSCHLSKQLIFLGRRGLKEKGGGGWGRGVVDGDAEGGGV